METPSLLTEIGPLLDTATDVIFILDVTTGEMIYLSKSVYSFFGYTEQEIKGIENFKSLLIHPDHLTLFNNILSEIIALNDSAIREITFKSRHASGESINVTTRFRIIKRTEEGLPRLILALSQNVNEKIKAEKILRESEERYKIMGQTIPFGVWMANNKGEIEYTSPSFLEVMGLTQEEMKHMGWLKRIPSKEAVSVMERWKYCFENGVDWDEELKYIGKDGREYSILCKGKPVKNEIGEITGWTGINLDITERKISEKNLREAYKEISDQKEELEKVKNLLEDFVYIVAHDLRSPVSTIKMALNIIDKLEDPLQKIQALHHIESAAQRLDLSLKGLVHIIQVQKENKLAQSVNLEEILRQVKQELAVPISTSGATFEMNLFTSQICYVEPFIYSILKNFISNSIKYASAERKPCIHIFTEKRDNFFYLKFSDNGSGMNLERVKKNLFQPFRRFNKNVEGIGVGLYIVKNMIEKNGGRIEVESTPNSGTTFHCYLKEYNDLVQNHVI